MTYQLGRVLITGGTGNLGRATAEQLRRRGVEFQVMSRNPGPDRVVVDLVTGAGLSKALDGFDTLINCATQPGKDEAMTRALVAEAERAGLGHFVHVSIVGVDRIPLKYYREKLAVEQLLERSSVPSTVLRATQFHDLLVALFGKLSKPPLMVVPARTPFQPVAVHDVARRLIAVAGDTPAGRVDDFGGPEVTDVADLARLWLEAVGRSRRVVRLLLPGGLAKAVRTGGLITPDHADATTTFAEYLIGGATSSTVDRRRTQQR